MGLGILFAGYITAFIMSYNPFIYLTRLIGLVIIFAALGKLSRYNRRFAQSRAALAALALAVGYFAVQPLIPQNTFADAVHQSAAVLMILLTLAFHYFLLFAIRSLATETGIEKIRAAAGRNFTVGVISTVITLPAMLPLPSQAEYIYYVGLSARLLEFVWYALNVGLIFSAYRRICLEGEEDLPPKKSRFEFINKMNASRDEFERQRFDEGKKIAQGYKNRKKSGKRRK